jgi:hypothetical protein
VFTIPSTFLLYDVSAGFQQVSRMASFGVSFVAWCFGRYGGAQQACNGSGAARERSPAWEQMEQMQA